MIVTMRVPSPSGDEPERSASVACGCGPRAHVTPRVMAGSGKDQQREFTIAEIKSVRNDGAHIHVTLHLLPDAPNANGGEKPS